MFQAGLYVMTLFDWYAGGLNVILVALFEVCGVAWIYGQQCILRIWYFLATILYEQP